MVLNAFLVEDRQEIRDTLIEAMQAVASVKFVGEAKSERAARAWLSANDGEWDLVIVDLFLDEGSGFGVLRECQTRSPRQKVIVLTGHSQDRVLAHCRVLGADAVFDKSEDVEKLVAFCKAHASELDSMNAPMGLITEMANVADMANVASSDAKADLYAS
jgi:DNA-binding NarL/FixJ family response regulator